MILASKEQRDVNVLNTVKSFDDITKKIISAKEMFLMNNQHYPSDKEYYKDMTMHSYKIDFDFIAYRQIHIFKGNVVYINSLHEIKDLKEGDRVLIIDKKSGNIQPRIIVLKNEKTYFGYRYEYDFLRDNLISINSKRYDYLGKIIAQGF